MAYRIQPVPHPDLATPLRIDHEVMPCLRRMMRMGIAIDIPYLQDLGSQFAAEIKRLEDDIKWSVPTEALELLLNEDTGDVDLNVGSPEQVAWLLFDVLELGKGKRLKFAKSTGRLATDKKQLELIKAENPIVRLLLRYRRLSKLKSTYCDALPRLAVVHPRGPDCPVCGRHHNESHPRIHTTFSTTRALTGRLASSYPNLQNIPARTDEGLLLRGAFVPSLGYRLISCDYSQIELRVFAHSSRDEYMIAIYQAEEDLHVETAKQAFGITDISAIPKDEWKQKYRAPAKCFHPDTEVLTPVGWKRILDLTPGEQVAQAVPKTGGGVELSWVEPLEVFSSTHSSGKLVHLYSEGMDLRVTPDHRMLGWDMRGNHRWVMPNQLDTTCRTWANAGMLDNKSDTILTQEDRDMLRVAVATQADGSYSVDKGIRFGFSKLRKVERLCELLDRVGLQYSLNYYEKTMVYSFYLGKQAAERVKPWLDDDKTLPWWWLTMGRVEREIVLDEAAHWDSWISHNRKTYRYDSAIRKNLDVLQAIAAITNRKTRLVKGLTVRPKHNSRTGNLRRHEFDYTGEVACLSVPSSYVLVRDGGVPVICGQTVNFGVAFGMTGQGLYVQLVLMFSEADLVVPGWLTESWCDAFIEKWFNVFPGVKAYLEHEHYCARKYGFVWTNYGRVRLTLETKSLYDNVRSEGYRQAGNHRIQGTAADINKMGLTAVHEELAHWRETDLDVEGLLTVHDEWVGEAPEEMAEVAAEAVKERMESVAELRSNLVADAGTMERWKK